MKTISTKDMVSIVGGIAVEHPDHKGGITIVFCLGSLFGTCPGH